MKVINLGTLSLEKCELSHYLSLIIIKVVIFWLSCNRKSMILRCLLFTDSNFKSAAPRKLRSQGLSLWNSPIPVEHRWAGLSCRWNPGGWGACSRLCFSAQPSQSLFGREHWSLSMDRFSVSPVGWGRKYRFAMGSSGLKEGSAVVREWAGNGQQGSGWQRLQRRVAATWGGEAELGSLGWRSQAWQSRAEKASLELQTVALGFGWLLPLSTLTPLSNFSPHLIFKLIREMQNQSAGSVQRISGSSTLYFLSWSPHPFFLSKTN